MTTPPTPDLAAIEALLVGDISPGRWGLASVANINEQGESVTFELSSYHDSQRTVVACVDRGDAAALIAALRNAAPDLIRLAKLGARVEAVDATPLDVGAQVATYNGGRAAWFREHAHIAHEIPLEAEAQSHRAGLDALAKEAHLRCQGANFAYGHLLRGDLENETFDRAQAERERDAVRSELPRLRAGLDEALRVTVEAAQVHDARALRDALRRVRGAGAEALGPAEERRSLTLTEEHEQIGTRLLAAYEAQRDLRVEVAMLAAELEAARREQQALLRQKNQALQTLAAHQRDAEAYHERTRAEVARLTEENARLRGEVASPETSCDRAIDTIALASDRARCR